MPPGYGQKPPVGYIVLLSQTFEGYAILRSILASGSEADEAKAVAYGKRVAVYPLSQAASPPPTVFVDAIDAVFDSTIPYDVRFFEALDRVVQREPWLDRDRVMIDELASVGIVKGKPFAPDAPTKTTLNAAAADARVLLERWYERAFTKSWVDGSRWVMPASEAYMKAATTGYADPNSYPVDDRGVVFSFAFFTPKHIGRGQFYLMTIADAEGHAPVRLYWSATVYDREKHTLIRDQEWASRSSQTPGLQQNADGSVDVWFGPRAPAGKESNWVPTDPKGRFEVLFRFYGPEKPLFDETWVLPNVVKSAS